MAEGESEAGVYDLTETGRGFGGPVPERFRDIRFVVAEFPSGIGAEGVAEGGGFACSFGLLKDSRVPKLHIKFHQHEPAKKEALSARSVVSKKAGGAIMMRRVRIRCVEEDIRICREDHDALRSRIASASGLS